MIPPGYTFGSVTDKISSIVLARKTPIGWWMGFGVAFLLTLLLFVSVTYLVFKGIGIWGNNIPIGWAFEITNFVWWIGIGHAGTLISAILLLLRQPWRTSINRFAEAMTLFAVACAALFPAIHTGRPWLDYWLLPYPNTMGVWPQFRSPIMWDVFAVSTYATVSLLFWFIGLIPDLATLRDRSQSKTARVIYGMLAMGWRGSARHWHRYETAYLLLAGLATPLVVSVHTVVSLDFAVAIVPGWHTTIFPPVFRCRCDLLGLRDGLDAGDSDSRHLQARGFHHHAALAEHGQGDARDRIDCGLRIHDRGVHRLVQRRQVRRLHDLEPCDRSLRSRLLGAALLQHRRAAGLVAATGSKQRSPAVCHLADRQRRHVARTIHHRRHQLASRFSDLVVGDVQPDDLGLEHLHRNARTVRRAVVPVSSVSADDFDLRDEDHLAGSEGGRVRLR